MLNSQPSSLWDDDVPEHLLSEVDNFELDQLEDVYRSLALVQSLVGELPEHRPLPFDARDLVALLFVHLPLMKEALDSLQARHQEALAARKTPSTDWSPVLQLVQKLDRPVAQAFLDNLVAGDTADTPYVKPLINAVRAHLAQQDSAQADANPHMSAPTTSQRKSRKASAAVAA